MLCEAKRKRHEVVESAKNRLKRLKSDEGKTDKHRKLQKWIDTLSANCTAAQLKTLCAGNSLMVGGSKTQLLDRLARCKTHGTAGECKLCGSGRIKYEYENEEDCFAPPVRISCRHFSSNGSQCPYTREAKELVMTPLMDCDYILSDSNLDGFPFAD